MSTFDDGDESTAATLVVGLVSGSHLVNHAYLVLLPPLIPTLTGAFDVSVAAIGLAIGVQGAVNAALQYPFGHLSDTRSRTLVLGVSLGFGCLGAVLTALAPTYAWLLVAQAVLGVGIAGHHPAHYPLLADAVADAHRSRAYSVHGFAGSLGFAIPPAVVAAVASVGGTWRHAILGVAALGGAFGLVCLLAVRRVPVSIRRPATPDDDAVRPRLRTIPRRLASDFSAALRTPALATLTALAFVASAAGWGIRTYAPLLLTEGYALGGRTANLVVTVMFVAGACLILVGGVLADRRGATPVLVGGFAALVVVAGVLSSALLPSLFAAVLCVVLSGTVSVSRPARSTLTDVVSARDDLGKNFALITIGITAGGAVAPPAFGWLAGVAGVESVFACVAALGVAGIGLTLGLHHVRPTAGAPTPADD